MLPQQQYCEKEFHKYYELISCLRVAKQKQNDEFLTKKHGIHPISFASFPEVSATIFHLYFHGRDTSAVRGFGSGYFSYSAPVPRPKHIGARPKEDRFWPRL